MSIKNLIVSLLLLLPSLGMMPDDDSSCYQQCFHQPPEACPSSRSSCRCRQLPNCKRAAVCCDINNLTLEDALLCGNVTADGVEALHIRNATLDVLNISLPVWRRLRLRYMTITDGKIKRVAGEFAKHSVVSCLNLSSNGIHKFERRSLVNLFNLSFLDLSQNNLSEVPSFKMEGAVKLDISANPSLMCASVEQTLNRSDILFKNENLTACLEPAGFHWFNTTESIKVSELKRIQQLEKDCFKNCTCERYGLELIIGKPSTFSIKMNCSGVKLLSLPVPLPERTRSLDVTNNNITSLKELSDVSYQYLSYLYADNNQIMSISLLEGTKFMNNFETLSLRNNKIKTIETYLLSNIKFYRTDSTRRLNLGQNKLIPRGKEEVWLLTKTEHIRDYRDIECENTNIRVINLDQNEMCQVQQDWTYHVYYVIAAEVFLLVGLITKVSYDYWVFKTAGYLPWPASKMPKLPCDWLCE
nr:protein halfway [Leptinotarsa decemlineata]